MVTRRLPASRARLRVHLDPATLDDAADFVAAAAASRRLHASWAAPPATRAAYRAWLKRLAAHPDRSALFLARRNDDGSLAGMLHFSEIVRGALQSAYVGYNAFEPNAGQGYMREAFVLALDIAFDDLGLHRVEANVQPTNARSLALAEAVGFVREGYSRRYVKVAGRWRDHVRYAMLAEDWPRAKRALLATVR